MIVLFISVTVTQPVVTPAAKVGAPFFSTKSDPAIAVPFAVAQLTDVDVVLACGTVTANVTVPALSLTTASPMLTCGVVLSGMLAVVQVIKILTKAGVFRISAGTAG